MTRPSPPALLPWTEVQSLGELSDASPVVQGWLEALRASPGEVLVLEQEGAPWGSFLRAQARPEVLEAGRHGPSGPAVRLCPQDFRIVPWAPGTWGPCAFGQVLWAGWDPSRVLPNPPRPFSASPPLPSLPSLPPLPPLPPSLARGAIERGGGAGDGRTAREEGRWVVQGLFRARADRSLQAHVRLFAEGPDLVAAESLRDRVGLRLAAELGAGFLRWRPGSPAHQLARQEWERHAVDRFHSGPLPPPPVEVLARPWSVPSARLGLAGRGPHPAGPGTLETALAGAEIEGTQDALWLGDTWGGGAPVHLPHASLLRHVGVVGTTGSGKSQLLAHLAAEACSKHDIPFVLFDLHGDLGPAVLSRLPAELVPRVVVVDGTRELAKGVVGLDVLGWERSPEGSGERQGSGPARSGGGHGLSDAEEDLLAGEFLSALRPAATGGEEFWGPRMERFLETAVRAVLESGGTLRDVAELLYHPIDRVPEVASGVHNPALAEALREWPTLLRRQPDLLASSQNRLLKVLLSPRVSALLACRSRPLVPERALAEGRSLLFHLPKGSLGEGSALFVANLLLARTFLGLLRDRAHRAETRPNVLFVLDEAQGFSSRLLRTIVEEGRKFGAACVFATQSPGRMEELFGRTPVDAAGTLIALRLPPTDAERVASALAAGSPGSRGGRGSNEGWGPELRRSLSTLPPHAAWVRRDGGADAELLRLPGPADTDEEVWERAGDRCASEVGSAPVDPAGEEEMEERSATEARAIRDVLLRAWKAELSERPLDLEGESADRTLFEPAPSRGELEMALTLCGRRGWLRSASLADGAQGIELTYAGWCRMGYREDCGAPRESAQHRRLLREAFRHFAAMGYLLELPRQGDMSRPTPDALLRLRPPRPRGGTTTPAQDLEELERLKQGPLWAYTGGRDLFVEAEVAGAKSPLRLRRSLQKARRARAFLLFLAGSPEDGARIETFLRKEEVGREEARVWTVPDRGPTLGPLCAEMNNAPGVPEGEGGEEG